MDIVARLLEVLPADQLSTQADQLAIAAHDESTLPGVTPLAVVWATSTSEIVAIVEACVQSKTPITTRGAGSALEGSAVPVPGGIVLDLSRMTKVLNLWTDDLQVEIEPGLIYDHLNEKLKNDGLFFPPSPGGSGDIATLGGMVATNASGIYSVKYGGTKDYLLALEVVTGTGEVVHLGNRAVKRSSGYNLVELIAGSEGTLGIVSKITLKLEGLPESRRQTGYTFSDDVQAARAVSEMKQYGLDLAAIEFLDQRLTLALNKLKDYGLTEAPLLFLEFHGAEAAIASTCEQAESICFGLGAETLKLADNQQPWEIRHWATDAVKHYQPGLTIMRNDVAFPISKLPEMVAYCHRLGDQSNIPMFTFGHVGMGLLHALMLADRNDSVNWSKAHDINNLIIKKTLELGGTISGEHGIGLGHKDLFEAEHGGAVELMRKIKSQFDPHGILNPGKIFDL
jgi:D-lactate dehydrogenase (cytochrome)